MNRRMRPAGPGLLALAALLLLSSTAGAQVRRGRLGLPTSPPTPLPTLDLTEPRMWVSGYTSAGVHRYDGVTGAHLGKLGPVPGAQSIRRGPDGYLYVCAELTNEVLRLDRHGVVDAFVRDDPLTPEDENGPLNGPTAAVFGPDGNLYVASFGNDRVLRYSGSTGLYMDTFVSARSGGLDGPDAGMDFGPDGRLYVPGFNSNRVYRYDGETGAFLNVFAGPAKGLANPRMIRFHSSGDVLVSSWGSNEILRFTSGGALVGTFLTLVKPTGFAIHPRTGDVFVTSDQSDKVVRYDRFGTRIGLFVPTGTGGLDGATYVEFFAP